MDLFVELLWEGFKALRTYWKRSLGNYWPEGAPNESDDYIEDEHPAGVGIEGTSAGAEAGAAVLTGEGERVQRFSYVSAVLGLIALFKIPISFFILFLAAIFISNQSLTSVEAVTGLINLFGMLFQLAAVFWAVLGLMALNKRRNPTDGAMTLVDITCKALLSASIVTVIVLACLLLLTDMEISELTAGAPLLIAGQLVLDAGAVYGPAERYKGLSVGQIWNRYKGGSLIIMAILGAVFVGIGGGSGGLFGMPDDVPGSYGTEVFVLLLSLFVIAVSIGLLFGFLFGLTAVRRWRYGGELASWNVWIERSVKANLIAGVVIFGAFYILTKVIMDMMLAS
jgi:hypothetical protein